MQAQERDYITPELLEAEEALLSEMSTEHSFNSARDLVAKVRETHGLPATVTRVALLGLLGRGHLVRDPVSGKINEMPVSPNSC